MGNKPSIPATADTVTVPDAGTTRRSRGRNPATRIPRSEDNASAPNHLSSRTAPTVRMIGTQTHNSGPIRRSNSNRSQIHHFTDHSREPITIPNNFLKPIMSNLFVKC
ncbi:hypothetical protein GEMRC1_002553 [Eukaryota sp. GEM-RC1]